MAEGNRNNRNPNPNAILPPGNPILDNTRADKGLVHPDFEPNNFPNPQPIGGKRRKHHSKTKKCRTKKHARKHKSRRSRA